MEGSDCKGKEAIQLSNELFYKQSSSNPSSIGHSQSLSNIAFSTEAEWYDYYNDYAKNKGFSIRRGEVKWDKHKNMSFRRFKCSRAEKRQRKHIDREDRVRKERPISRCDCPAKLEIRYNRENHIWISSLFNDFHNHLLANPREVPFLLSQRKMDKVHKQEVDTLVDAHLRKHKIIDMKEVENNGYENIGYTPRDLYNYCHRRITNKLAKGDVQAILNKMSAFQEKSKGYFYATDYDKDNHLNRLFWSDEQSRLDYQYYGDVILFDSTYRTNRYKMPFIPIIGVNNHRRTCFFGCGVVADEKTESFVWLLKTFLLCMYQSKPKTVVTDGDSSMRQAILEVLPDATHRSCCWHIERNLTKHVKDRKKIGRFKELMYTRYLPREFEMEWKKYATSLTNRRSDQWIKRMYCSRSLWAETYFHGKVLLGIRSTQRSEGTNALLHKYFNHNMILEDLVSHYDLCVSRARRNEALDDCIATQTTPYLRMDAHPLERFAAKTYTPTIVVWIQDQLSEASRFMMCTSNVVGVPCSHMLLLMIQKKFEYFPPSCVWDRWKINCRFCIPPYRNTCLLTVDINKQRYQELLECAKRLCLECGNSEEKFLEMKGWFAEKLFEARNLHMDKNVKFEEAEVEEFLGTKMLDPLQSNPKGGLSKRPKSHSEKRSYKCSNCGHANHQYRTCPYDVLEPDADYSLM